MSMDFGDEQGLDKLTARGREWPCLRQFGVFMENRVGRLHDLMRHIETHDLRVVALSIVDSIDYAVARLIVDHTDRAREVFELSNFTFYETDIIGVALPDTPAPYVSIFTALLQAEQNIFYTYPLLYRRRGHGGIAVYTDDIDQSLRVLREKGHTLITENSLQEDDEFL